MKLEALKKKLEMANYLVFLYTDQIHVGTNPTPIPNAPFGIYDGFCIVYLQGENYLVDYTRAQLPEEQEFSTESEVVYFIKKQFPL
jgi:hypothetical protein